MAMHFTCSLQQAMRVSQRRAKGQPELDTGLARNDRADHVGLRDAMKPYPMTLLDSSSVLTP